MKYKYILFSFLLILTLFYTAGCASSDPQSSKTVSVKNSPGTTTTNKPNIPAAASPTPSREVTNLLSQSKVSVKNDPTPKKLIIKMTDGKNYENKDSGPYTGWIWEGKFELQLMNEKENLISSLSLNNVFQEDKMVFKNPFSLNFQDYNNDGSQDFAIGQYASSKNYVFKIFSVNPAGKIIELPFKKGIEFFSSEKKYSPTFRKLGMGSFITYYYDDTVQNYFDTVFTWAEDGFVRTKDRIQHFEIN